MSTPSYIAVELNPQEAGSGEAYFVVMERALLTKQHRDALFGSLPSDRAQLRIPDCDDGGQFCTTCSSDELAADPQEAGNLGLWWRHLDLKEFTVFSDEHHCVVYHAWYDE